MIWSYHLSSKNYPVNDLKQSLSLLFNEISINIHPNGSHAFWTLANHVNNNFNNYFYSSLSTDDGTINTSSKEKAELFAKIFSTNSTLNRPANLELPSVPEGRYRLRKINCLTKANHRCPTGSRYCSSKNALLIFAPFLSQLLQLS